MTSLDDLLGDEFHTPDAALARDLALEDEHLLTELIRIRKERGFSQQHVADALGISQASVSAFERLGNDPHLSTVRRYSRAIGVMIRHHVDDAPQNCCNSELLSHMSSTGIHIKETASAIARAVAVYSEDWTGEEDFEVVAGPPLTKVG